MADVRAERGQLILVTGVVLAVALVGLALVLNSVVFTESLATRNQEQGSNTMLSERANAAAEFDESITRVNGEVVTSNKSDWLRQNLTAVIERREARLTRQAALSGGTVDYSLASATEGTRIRQTNASRNFTAGNETAGDDDWVVVEDAESLRHFRIVADRGALYESTIDTTRAAMADSAFNVNVTDANGDTWRVYMFRGVLTDNVYVLVEEPGEDFVNSLDGYEAFVGESCSYSNETVTVWMTEAIVENSKCDQLEFLQDDAAFPLTVRYDNTYDESSDVARIRGTYDLLVDKQISRSPSPYYLSSEGQSPFTQKAIVGAQIQMHYQGRETEYYSSIESEPNSIGPTFAVNNPQVDNWAIVDDNSTTLAAEYKMEWAVSDEDGDLAQVRLFLAGNTTSLVYDSETIDVSGTTASGTTTLDDSTLGLDAEYRLEIVVVDEEGGADSEVILDEADGNP